MKMSSKERKGFTLIEMTIVLFIISLLVLIIIPNISHSRDNAEKIHKNAMVSVVQTQLDNYLDDHPNVEESNIKMKSLEGSYLTPDQVKKADDEKIGVGLNNDKKATVYVDNHPVNINTTNSDNKSN